VQRQRGFDERILAHVLGVGSRSADQVGGSERDVLMARDERRVRVPITTLGCLDQLSVSRLVAG
jgi:hypothetical protein